MTRGVLTSFFLFALYACTVWVEPHPQCGASPLVSCLSTHWPAW
jgi:hypothetical protein